MASAATEFGQYSSKGAGGEYQKWIRGPEDAVFHENAEFSQWTQGWKPFTPHQKVLVVHEYNTQGFGRPMIISNFPKTSDGIFSGYNCLKTPAITGSQADEEPAFVNAIGLYAFETDILKVASTPLFHVDGTSRLVYMDIMGLLDSYASAIGFCKTPEGLIAQSRKPQTFYGPLFLMPFHEKTDSLFYNGAVYLHGLSWETKTRSLDKLVVQMGRVKPKRLPLCLSTGNEINDKDFKMALAINHVWLSDNERALIKASTIEKLFTETIHCGDFQIEGTNIAKTEKLSLDAAAPLSMIWVTIQSNKDIASGNHMKQCNDQGEDYVEELMLFAGSVAYEDSMPANYWRTIKPLEVFQSAPQMFTYVLPFETKGKSANTQPRGLYNAVNADKFEIRARFKPHLEPLTVNVKALAYNVVYQEDGTAGKLWHTQ